MTEEQAPAPVDLGRYQAAVRRVQAAVTRECQMAGAPADIVGQVLNATLINSNLSAVCEILTAKGIASTDEVNAALATQMERDADRLEASISKPRIIT